MRHCYKPILSITVLALLCVVMVQAGAEDELQKHPSCKYCGMDRRQYAFSRTSVLYRDGEESAFCSLHCLAIDLALNTARVPRSIRVGDYGTRELIDAETAFWVVGGTKSGVMTSRAKWAFEKKDDAETFIKGHGGVLVTFEDALKASYEDMYLDSKMIRSKMKIRMMLPDEGRGNPGRPADE
jgi:copper chaperone NosL